MDAVQRYSPRLIIVTVTGKDDEVALDLATLRDQIAPDQMAPVVLIGDHDLSRMREKTGAADWLAQPFTDSHLRTRRS